MKMLVDETVGQKTAIESINVTLTQINLLIHHYYQHYCQHKHCGMQPLYINKGVLQLTFVAGFKGSVNGSNESTHDSLF